MTCNNPKVGLVNMNGYIKFEEILSICSQDIERKWNNEGQNYGRTDRVTDNPFPIKPPLFKGGL